MKRPFFVLLTILFSLQALCNDTFLCGKVVDQDGNAIANATVEYYVAFAYSNECYSTTTASDGSYSLVIDDDELFWEGLVPVVSASGYATFINIFGIDDFSYDLQHLDYVLYSKVAYKKDVRSTIILQSVPDASKGRYYGLGHLEKPNKVVFVREPNPKVNTPYIIFPYEDFNVDVSNLNPNIAFGETKADGIRFRGIYNSSNIEQIESDVLLYPDETRSFGWEIGVVSVLHAFITIECPFDGFDAYGAELVFWDDTQDAIIAHSAGGKSVEGACYDLQGRRLKGRPAKGIYIESGRKRVVG